jgi:Phosphotransferase enzyme family
MTFTESQKDSIARKLAIIVVDLVQVRFDMIGGLDPEGFIAAPTVEGPKLFKGRGKFHKNECYPISPYKTTKDYILACYDKEIYYYTHASKDDIDADLFEDTSITDFVEQLNRKRAALAATDITDEPFVLIHGDFHGRNIMMKGD